MLFLIRSIECDEIHGNMHKCGKTYSKFTKRLQIRSNKYSAYRSSWIFDLNVWTTENADTRNVS